MAARLAIPATGRTLVGGALLLGLLLAVTLLVAGAQKEAGESTERRFSERAKISAALTQSVFTAIGAASGEQLDRRYGGAREDVARGLARQFSRSRGMGYLAVVDAHGRPLATAGRTPRRLALSAAARGGPALSDVVRVGNRRFVEYAVPFGAPESRRALVQGVPFETLAAFFSEYLSRLHSVDQAGLALADSRGTTLTRQGRISQPGKTAPDRVATTAAVPGTDWTLRLEADRDRVFAGVNHVRWLPWLLLAALGLATVTGIWLHARMIASARRQREANLALQESREQLSGLVDALEEAVILHHADGVTELLNASARELVDAEGDVVHGPLPEWKVLDEDGAPLNDEDTPIQQALATGSAARRVIGLEGPNGARRWLHVRARPLVRAGEQRPHAVVATCTDVTEQRAMELHLTDLSQRDALTGLWNRRRFEDDLGLQLARCRRYGERAALLLLDLDNFKEVNDTLGHLAGDEVLRALAEALTQRLRASDSAARIGGDEFAVLLLNVDEEEARGMASEVAERLTEYAHTLDTRRDLSVSVGVAVLDGSSGGQLEAFAAADRAMYIDKRRSGRSAPAGLAPDEVMRTPVAASGRIASLRALLAAVQARDSETAAHSREVVTLARAVARRLDLDERQISTVESAALLHDLGKIAVPDAILHKRGPLSAHEELLMQQHPIVGAQIVSAVPELEHLAPAIRAEHERWDGAGYPDGLAGRAIPLASRITFVCDAYHAMTTDRPYRRALSKELALAQIAAESGRQFCPDSTRALLAVLRGQAAEQQDPVGAVADPVG